MSGTTDAPSDRGPAPLKFQHATPAFRTFCGEDALAALPGQLDRLKLRRAVIVCDPSIASRHAEALQRVESALGERLVGRFDAVEPHSPVRTVLDAARVLEDQSADTVVVVGGGSSIVTARGASIVVAEGSNLREFCTRRDEDGKFISPRLTAPKLQQWIVPTTPTTAYAKAGCALRDEATGDRLALFDPKLRAQAIFLDPTLALTAPVPVTLGAALNAFAMAVEGLQSKLDDPLTEALLMHALRMLGDSIPRLVRQPEDDQTRLQLMLASVLSGQGSDYVGGGLAQALSHATGPRSTTSNGVVEALFLPHVIKYNAPVVKHGLDKVASALGYAGGEADSGTEAAVAGVERVLEAAAVPRRLRDVGVDGDALADIARHVLEDWTISRIPRTVTRDNVETLLGAAW
ncbi:iron-containing alcohol dehydrogenase family protein [Conexibacter sp. S30A1]|uniref:iron-containing alcohol dehydrogenase family protein n=1 Tax=Conexibacter sp. S30A1 TaxID=2937800 RepID=UPI0035313F20